LGKKGITGLRKIKGKREGASSRTIKLLVPPLKKKKGQTSKRIRFLKRRVGKRAVKGGST